MKLIPSPTHDTPDSPQIVFSPAVRIDAAMQVLYANPAARMAGIGTGDTLFLRHGTCERLRHEACFHRSPLTRYDPLGSPQNAALFALENTGPFRIAYVEYTYTFHQCRAIAVLFRTRQEYLRFAAALDRGPRRYCGLLLHTLRSLRDECRQQLTQPDAQPSLSVDTVEELMTVTLLTLQCFYPDTIYTGAKRLYSLHRTVESYIRALADYAHTMAIHLDLSYDAASSDLYTSMDPECLYLLLTALLSAISDLSEDHAAHIWLTEQGEDRTIHIRTRCERLSRLLCHTADVQALAAGAPHKEMQITMAEFLAGYCRYEIDICGDEDAHSLIVRLHMPAHPAQPDFKSPLYADAHLESTLHAICRLLTLMDTDQQKQDHNDIHGPLVLGTEEEQ